jgi:signal transduction histidine kinase
MVSLVLRNLLSNAIKFTPNEGSVYIGVLEKGDRVETFIKDTGMGMESTVVKNLFDNSFYTTIGTDNETGTGIGLMLCKDFLAKNAGTIHVTSEQGFGSTFSFMLPKE